MRWSGCVSVNWITSCKMLYETCVVERKKTRQCITTAGVYLIHPDAVQVYFVIFQNWHGTIEGLDLNTAITECAQIHPCYHHHWYDCDGFQSLIPFVFATLTSHKEFGNLILSINAILVIVKSILVLMAPLRSTFTIGFFLRLCSTVSYETYQYKKYFQYQ